PIFSIIPLCCCMVHARAEKRASFNLGVGVGCLCWGVSMIVLAILAKGPVLNKCVSLITNIVLAQVESGLSSSDIASQITGNSTRLDMIYDQIQPTCSKYLSYAIYGFIGIGALCVGASVCMGFKSRKMLNKGIAVIGQNF
ncbi:hypothetical protein HK100_012087, partial [Physocladia obscura]